MYSKIWFTLSLWPLVWGWYVELLINLVPSESCSCSQNLATNWAPQPEIIVRGIPCKHTIRSMYNSAYLLVGNVVCMRRKWSTLVNLSTATHMESWFSEVLGNPMIKSMLISSHFQEDIGSSCKALAALRWLSLTIWQVSHSDTYLAISLFILVH